MSDPRDDGRATVGEVSQTLLHALESAHIGVTILAVGPDGAVERLFANEALARVLGLTLGELQQMPVGLPVTPEDRPAFESMFAAWLRGERLPSVFRMTVVTPAGVRVPVEVTASVTRLRERPVTVAFLRDLTERVGMEDALRQSEARFRKLAEGAPDGIAVHVRGRLAYANPPIIRMLGAGSFEELAREGILARLPDEERVAMVGRLAQVAAGATLGPYEYHFTRTDGAGGIVEVHSIAFDHEGQPAVLSFAREVTERRRMLEDLRRADRLAALGTLAAAVAHEVNNPLTYVLLHLGELQDVLPQLVPAERADEAGKMIEEALEGAERVRGIVRDLLSFARTDPGSRQPVAVEQAMESAIKLAGNVLRHRAAILRDYSPVRPVMASRARLEQVFLNLLVNAAQAIPEDRAGPGEIQLAVRPGDDQSVIIEVTDDGPGIPEADLPRVFEPFFTTKPEGIGTGLGLAICRTIVDSLGGDISVRCPPGGGTVVRVRLPTTSRLPTPTPLPAPRRDAGTTPVRGRLLVIDDEVRLAKLLASLIGERHDVRVATSATDALQALRSGAEFDVVFCDLMMPEMTGMELHELVCRERPEMGPRFVFLTGGAFTERAARFVAQPDVTTILKPFDLEQLEATIQARLSRQR